MKSTIKNMLSEISEKYITCEEDQDPVIDKKASKALKDIPRPKFTKDNMTADITSTFWTKTIHTFSELNLTHPETCINCGGLGAKGSNAIYRDVGGFCPSYKTKGTHPQNKIAEKMGVGSIRHHGRYLQYDEKNNINYKLNAKKDVLIGMDHKFLKAPHTSPLPKKTAGRSEAEVSGSAHLITQTVFRNEIKGIYDAIDELEAYVNDQEKITPRITEILKELSESSIFIYEEELD
jgi:hypothetical protein